ncbi:hypothetical protein BN946_scf184793.g3 [Trametes cinnabarina]|uniref:Uncharacterized protein n=1 Tax=Pycnoporus cinnabarinus TaxID=5643 RepID=A0A060SVT3_PYCCI|nr:hypothetical protein BN946_scf184793.g3 [Trametes cinnabarina]
MSTADAVKQLEQQLEQLKKKVAEDERVARRQAEEEARKREEEKAKAKKRKAPESDDESDSGEEVEQEPGLLVPRCGCEQCREKGVRCAFRPGKRNSTCDFRTRSSSPRVDRKAAAAAVDPRKRAKKSDPTVDDNAAEYAPPATPSCKSGKKTEKAKGSEKPMERSAEKEKGKGKGKAFARTRSPEPRALGAESGWSADPENLSDRELIEHLLVEGQRTRQAPHKVWRYLDEEVEVREELIASDLRDIRVGVRSSVRKELSKMEAGVREVVRDEVAKALAAYFGSKGSSPDAAKEDGAEMAKEGEGSGTGAGEREKEGEKEGPVADPE